MKFTKYNQRINNIKTAFEILIVLCTPDVSVFSMFKLIIVLISHKILFII